MQAVVMQAVVEYASDRRLMQAVVMQAVVEYASGGHASDRLAVHHSEDLAENVT